MLLIRTGELNPGREEVIEVRVVKKKILPR